MESTERYERSDTGSIPVRGSNRTHMKKHIFKVGEKVRVPKWMAVHKRYNRGIITLVDGANVLVKLNYKDVVCHLYITEITLGWR